MLESKNPSTKKKDTKKYDLYNNNKMKVAKHLITDDTFRSCYCGTVFKHCHDCLFGLCSTHNTIKCRDKCSRLFHIECTDISIPISLPINSQNSVESSSSYVKVYYMGDETNLLHTERLCMKCNYEKVTPVILHFNKKI